MLRPRPAFRRLPPGVLAQYFFNACSESWPMTAFTAWLYDDLGMSLATSTQFWAFIFIPYYLRPLYALLANSLVCLPKRSRAVLLQACGLGAALLYLLVYWVTTAAQAFALFFAIELFNGCAQCMLGAYLMDAVHDDMRDVGAVQGVAGAVKAAGSLAATVALLGIYPCNEDGAPNARTMIMVTGVFPLVNALLSLHLPDSGEDEMLLAPQRGVYSPDHHHQQQQQQEAPQAAGSSVAAHGPGAEDVGPTTPATVQPTACGTDAVPKLDSTINVAVVEAPKQYAAAASLDVGLMLRMSAVVALLEVLLVWISVKDLVDEEHRWWIVLYALLGPVLLAVVLLLHHAAPDCFGSSDGRRLDRDLGQAQSSPFAEEPLLPPEDPQNPSGAVDYAVGVDEHAPPGSLDTKTGARPDRLVPFVLPALFLFVYNATPSASGQLYSYSYWLFFYDSPCKYQQLQVVGSVGSVAGYLVYSVCCTGRGIRAVLVVTTVLSALAGLLWLPLCEVWDAPDPAHSCVALFASAPNDGGADCRVGTMPSFWYAVLLQCVTTPLAALALAPSTVLATESSPLAQRTLVYSVFLSVIDSGESASGWITAPIVRRLGLDWGEWAHLNKLVWIATICKITALVLLPLVRNWKDSALARSHR